MKALSPWYPPPLAIYDSDSDVEDDDDEDEEDDNDRPQENIVIVDPCKCPLEEEELVEFRARVTPLESWEDWEDFKDRYWEANEIINEIIARDV